MTTKISLLTDLVINQIAAGEVLENPASAVKELLENSIDAGATEICTEIEGGGLQRILVEDDGCGMSEGDAVLCLKRHATSKIRTAEDLDFLSTMGFRGEALAALASVSKLELKTADGRTATRITPLNQIEPAARNRGTTIDARSLFYNAPARLKFQKSSSACAAAVLRVVQAVALSNPQVSFRLLSNGKPTLQVKATTWKERVEELLGPFAHELKSIPGPISIKGLMGRPEDGKVNRSGQMVYVNRRPIYSPLISRAVKEGFGTRMQEALFPSFVIFLELPSDQVDVNVHPQKKEVRFREEGRLFALVRDCIMASFGQAPPLLTPLPWDFTPGVSAPFTASIPMEFCLQEAPLPLSIEIEPVFKAVLGDFLLLEKENWVLVDLKGAEARILFDQLETTHPDMQPLLYPLEIQVQEEAEVVMERVKSLYIEARCIGKYHLAVDAVPVGIDLSQVEAFIRYFTEEKSERKVAAALTKICRSARKNYSLEEARLIWLKLKQCKDKVYDPLGRKISVELTEKQLAEYFE